MVQTTQVAEALERVHWWDELGRFPLKLPALPYGVDALEPWIDAETMELHYFGHQKGYMEKSNALLSASGLLEPTEQVMKRIAHAFDSGNGSEPLQRLAFNLGGFVNHTIFWHSMSPTGGGPWKGSLARRMKGAFGSYENFSRLLKAQVLAMEGSGWVWLCMDLGFGHLRLMCSSNQESPVAVERFWPLFGLDVWEHAHYLRYKFDRGAYVDAFLEVLDWEGINKDFEALFGF